jgi:ABC-type sugar transport system ATPase subunit
MGEGPANAAVRIAALAKHYGRVAALSGVDLEVRSGEAFGLVGANGAGKTTLIKCMLDLCAYDAGSIEIFGISSALPESRRRLAYVPERFVPPYYLRCREFLEMLVRASDQRYEATRAESMLRELELDAAVLERPVRQLSKGMTQKLGLAACFLLERDLYLLDEPMSGRGEIRAAPARRRGQDAVLHLPRPGRRGRAVHLHRSDGARPRALAWRARSALCAVRGTPPRTGVHEVHSCPISRRSSSSTTTR